MNRYRQLYNMYVYTYVRRFTDSDWVVTMDKELYLRVELRIKTFDPKELLIYLVSTLWTGFTSPRIRPNQN